MGTKETVDRYYELANAGDWDAWCDLFADDLVMDEQLAGHVEGIAPLREMMRGFPETFAEFANKPVHTVIEGPQAAVISTITARTHSGANIEAGVCNYFRIEDGRITYMANYHDSAPFAPILEPQEA
jgi:ketosteroid isomerase-like protein